jgi:beta-glucosidase
LVVQLGIYGGINAINRPNLTIPGFSYGRECLSGVAKIKIPSNNTGTTAFPNPVNLGMTFDPQLVEAVGSAIGDEARALWNANLGGFTGLCLSPVLNVARDPRWGRNYESYGEDPFLIFSLGQRYIAGLQYGPVRSAFI